MRWKWISFELAYVSPEILRNLLKYPLILKHSHEFATISKESLEECDGPELMNVLSYSWCGIIKAYL